MPAPLMPKATAVWLVENTSLTFDQIADFCGLHPLVVQAIADGEVAVQMHGVDPVSTCERGAATPRAGGRHGGGAHPRAPRERDSRGRSAPPKPIPRRGSNCPT